jgi:hypothetical protein
MDTSRQYESREVAKILDIAPRRLQGWAEQGLLTGTVAGEGQGSRRRYTARDLVAGVWLLALQGLVGERSPLIRKAMPALLDAAAKVDLDRPAPLALIVGRGGKLTYAYPAALVREGAAVILPAPRVS